MTKLLLPQFLQFPAPTRGNVLRYTAGDPGDGRLGYAGALGNDCLGHS